MKGREAFANGTEFLDWQEVWCCRCANDHDITHETEMSGLGCPIILTAQATDDDVPEWEPSSYDVHGRKDDGATGTMEVRLPFDIPAPVFCTAFVPCDKLPTCSRHRGYGPVITKRERVS